MCNGLARPADYSIFPWKWTCPPVSKPTLTQEWIARMEIVLAYGHRG